MDKWTDMRNVDAGPETGKKGNGNPNAVNPKKIHTDAKPPKWSDPQPVVEEGPRGE